jgi:hypothetical protein
VAALKEEKPSDGIHSQEAKLAFLAIEFFAIQCTSLEPEILTASVPTGSFVIHLHQSMVG